MTGRFPSPARIICIGEGMLELRLGATLASTRVATGGDTLNTAVHLARRGVPVGFLSAMGQDAVSDRLIAQWETMGVDCATVARIPGGRAGIYAIEVDAGGERRFSYWRSDSAARRLWSSPVAEAAIARVAEADLVYLSGITLSLTDDAGRARLFDLLKQVRGNGGRVAFDINYRPAGWPDRETARKAVLAALAQADIALPSVEDAAALFDRTDPDGVADLAGTAGCGEIVVKDGAKGCLVRQDGNGIWVRPERVVDPVDTTGAGDSFNAAYIAARLQGADPVSAAQAGNALAARTVMHPGALPETD